MIKALILSTFLVSLVVLAVVLTKERTMEPDPQQLEVSICLYSEDFVGGRSCYSMKTTADLEWTYLDYDESVQVGVREVLK